MRRKSETRMTRGQKREDKRQKTGDNEIEIFCRAHKILRAVFQLLLELKKKVFLFSLFVRPEFWILGSKKPEIHFSFKHLCCQASVSLSIYCEGPEISWLFVGPKTLRLLYLVNTTRILCVRSSQLQRTITGNYTAKYIHTHASSCLRMTVRCKLLGLRKSRKSSAHKSLTISAFQLAADLPS